MEYIGLLAPVAFVFAFAARAQICSMKKEMVAKKTESSRETAG